MADGFKFNPDYHSLRRNSSLVLPGNRVSSANDGIADIRTRSFRMSTSSLSERRQSVDEVSFQGGGVGEVKPEKKGIWKWKPIKALTHLTMQKLSCMFTVDVIAVRSLPPSMNGLRVAVSVRKKESKEGSVQTMPARVSDGAADFEDTLFVKCNVYFSPGGGFNVKFEPRPFLAYVVAVDATELDFGRGSVDLSALIQESIARGFEGTRINKWDKRFSLSGDAEGGELVLKLGYQFMEKDGGFKIQSQKPAATTARRSSRKSFSFPFQRLSLQKVDEVVEENGFPEFGIAEKGVEIEETASDKASVSNEIVKEVVRDPFYVSELDSIAMQIKALNSAVVASDEHKDKSPSPTLDADEDKVTRKFLKLLEDLKILALNQEEGSAVKSGKNEEDESDFFVPDLGKGLGCVVQTRNGGFLVAMNPFETPVAGKDNLKLAMQLSKAVVIGLENASGFEIFRRMVKLGLEQFTAEILNTMPIDELVGKTAEKMAFEGIASAIIAGRNKEGASSSAARTIDAVKSMAKAMNASRKRKTPTGILNSDEVLPFAIRVIETMAVNALKIQAETGETEAPSIDSPDSISEYTPFSAIALQDCIKENKFSSTAITIAVVIQFRDPMREYEAVGGPMIAVVDAAEVEENEEKKYKLVSVELGGVKVKSSEKKTSWDGEKEKLTALHWLVANGLVKAEKKGKPQPAAKKSDVFWRMAARVAGDALQKPNRDGDIIFTN